MDVYSISPPPLHSKARSEHMLFECLPQRGKHCYNLKTTTHGRLVERHMFWPDMSFLPGIHSAYERVIRCLGEQRFVIYVNSKGDSLTH